MSITRRFSLNLPKALSLVAAVFLSSGLFKSLLNSFGFIIPFDITPATGLLVLSLMLINNRFIKHHHQGPIFLLFLFTAWAMFTSTYTSSDNYYLIKILKTGQICVAFLAGYYVISKNSEIYFLRIMILLSITLGLIYSYRGIYLAALNRNWEEITAAYLGISLLNSFAFTALVVFNKRLFKPPVLIALIVICLITLFGSGGRGGILFSFFSVIVYGVFERKNAKQIFSGFLVIMLATIAAYYQFDEIKVLFERSIYRLSFLFSEDKGSSVDGRLELINFTFNKIADNPIFGYGIGSFSKEYYNIDGRYYPHNIFLEIWFELGVIGVFIFGIFLLTLLFKFNVKKNIAYFVIMLPPLLNSLKSLEFTEHRLLFFCFGMILCLSNIKFLFNYNKF